MNQHLLDQWYVASVWSANLTYTAVVSVEFSKHMVVITAMFQPSYYQVPTNVGMVEPYLRMSGRVDKQNHGKREQQVR